MRNSSQTCRGTWFLAGRGKSLCNDKSQKRERGLRAVDQLQKDRKKGPPGNQYQASPITVKKWLRNNSSGHSVRDGCRKDCVRHTPAVVPKIYGRHPCLADSRPLARDLRCYNFFRPFITQMPCQTEKNGLIESCARQTLKTGTRASQRKTRRL